MVWTCFWKTLEVVWFLKTLFHNKFSNFKNRLVLMKFFCLVVQNRLGFKIFYIKKHCKIGIVKQI